MEQERADILINMRAEEAERQARELGKGLDGLSAAEREVANEARKTNDVLDEQARQASRTERTMGQTSASLRRAGRSARSSSRLIGRMSEALRGADGAASGLSGTLGRLVPGLADGAMVVGDLSNAAEAFAGAGGAVLRVLGPIGVAVAAGALAWKIYADELDRANEKAREAAELATQASKAFGGISTTKQTVDDEYRLATGQVTQQELDLRDRQQEIRQDFAPGQAVMKVQLSTLTAERDALRESGGADEGTQDRIRELNRGISRKLGEIEALDQQLEDALLKARVTIRRNAEAQDDDSGGGGAPKVDREAQQQERELTALLEGFGFTPEQIQAGGLTGNAALVAAARDLAPTLAAESAPPARTPGADIEEQLSRLGVGQLTRTEQLGLASAQVQSAAGRGEISQDQATTYLAQIAEAQKADADAQAGRDKESLAAARDQVAELEALSQELSVERAEKGAGAFSALAGGDLVGAAGGLSASPYAGVVMQVLSGLGSLGAEGAEGTLDAIEEQIGGILGGVEALPEFVVGLAEYVVTRLPVELAKAILRTIADILGRLFDGAVAVFGEIRDTLKVIFAPRSEEARAIREERRGERQARREQRRGDRSSFFEETFGGIFSSASSAAPRTFDVGGLNDGRRIASLMGGEEMVRRGDSPSQAAAGRGAMGSPGFQGEGGGLSVVFNGPVYGDADAIADRVLLALRARVTGGFGTASSLGVI